VWCVEWGDEVHFHRGRDIAQDARNGNEVRRSHGLEVVGVVERSRRRLRSQEGRTEVTVIHRGGREASHGRTVLEVLNIKGIGVGTQLLTLGQRHPVHLGQVVVVLGEFALYVLVGLVGAGTNLAFGIGHDFSSPLLGSLHDGLLSTKALDSRRAVANI